MGHLTLFGPKIFLRDALRIHLKCCMMFTYHNYTKLPHDYLHKYFSWAEWTILIPSLAPKLCISILKSILRTFLELGMTRKHQKYTKLKCMTNSICFFKKKFLCGPNGPFLPHFGPK